MENQEMTKALATTPGATFAMADIERIGTIIAKSNLFGVKTAEQAIALCLIAHAEGQHPATAALDYDIIQNRPALKARALLARFQAAGGKVEWGECSDDSVTGTFTHPAGGSVTVTWDEDRIKQAGLQVKATHKQYPQQMKRARCISEGVTAVFPGAAKFYVQEEVAYFEPQEPRDITAEVNTGKSNVVQPPVKPVAKAPKASKATAEKPKAEDVQAKLAAARAAAAARKEKPEVEQAPDPDPEPEQAEEVASTSDAEGAFPPPTGAKMTKAGLSKLFEAYKAYGVTPVLLEKWRGLPKEEWTESVLVEMRGMFLMFKNGEIDKEGLEGIIA